MLSLIVCQALVVYAAQQLSIGPQGVSYGAVTGTGTLHSSSLAILYETTSLHQSYTSLPSTRHNRVSNAYIHKVYSVVWSELGGVDIGTRDPSLSAHPYIVSPTMLLLLLYSATMTRPTDLQTDHYRTVYTFAVRDSTLHRCTYCTSHQL